MFRLPDPVAYLSVDNVHVATSTTIKKTLSPNWNESFDLFVPIASHYRPLGAYQVLVLATTSDLLQGGRRVECNQRPDTRRIQAQQEEGSSLPRHRNRPRRRVRPH